MAEVKSTGKPSEISSFKFDNGGVFTKGTITFSESVLGEQVTAAGSPANPRADTNDDIWSVSFGFGGVQYDNIKINNFGSG